MALVPEPGNIQVKTTHPGMVELWAWAYSVCDLLAEMGNREASGYCTSSSIVALPCRPYLGKLLPENPNGQPGWVNGEAWSGAEADNGKLEPGQSTLTTQYNVRICVPGAKVPPVKRRRKWFGERDEDSAATNSASVFSLPRWGLQPAMQRAMQRAAATTRHGSDEKSKAGCTKNRVQPCVPHVPAYFTKLGREEGTSLFDWMYVLYLCMYIC